MNAYLEMLMLYAWPLYRCVRGDVHTYPNWVCFWLLCTFTLPYLELLGYGWRLKAVVVAILAHREAQVSLLVIKDLVGMEYFVLFSTWLTGKLNELCVWLLGIAIHAHLLIVSCIIKGQDQVMNLIQSVVTTKPANESTTK